LLEIRDLRLVLALAAAGTTARASAHLHVTQPAVSRALLAIEDRLGTRLFERMPRGLVLTDAGQRLVDGARGLLVELAELERGVCSPRPRRMRLRLVCACYTAYHWLPSVLAKLRVEIPDLDVVLAIEFTADPVAALESGEIDVALLTVSAPPRGDVEERALFMDEVVFVLARSHPLAARRALTVDDLAQSTLLSSNVPATEAAWFRAKVLGRKPRRLRFETFPLTEAVLDCARAGMGIAVLSEWIASPHLRSGELVAKRLRSGPLQRPWRLAYRCEVRDAALRLLPALQATVPRGHPLG
jgi:LysR family transcriptional regulator for metE and metH